VQSIYRGRFAPSPTGPLHFGSLVAALGSYLQAKHQGGEWLVRIEDLDVPRNQPGAAHAILRTLRVLGLVPDGEIIHQTARHSAYHKALAQLRSGGLTFSCACTRAQVGDRIYSGTCRHSVPPGRRRRSMRIKVDDRRVSFDDRIQGFFEQHLSAEVGDFVIHRADGVVAYHLATVLDDAWQGVTEIVRGADLLDSTPRQMYLQQLLGLPTPRYVHLPLAVDIGGSKLSKQNGAPPIDESEPTDTLRHALEFLGQNPPNRLKFMAVAEALHWAVENWTLANVPRTPKVVVTYQSQ